MLAMPAPPRNSLRSLRELRSNNRGEPEERGALRARAGTAALLGCAQAHRRRGQGHRARNPHRPVTRTFAGTAAALASDVAVLGPRTTDVALAAGECRSEE